MLVNILLCVLIADFITGLIHWLEDTYGLPSWPLLGRSVILPNIDHHRNPGLIGSMTSFVARNYQSFLGGFAVLGILWYIGVSPVYSALTMLLASLGNEVHMWSHRKTNWFIELLQEMAIIITPRNHAKHHRPPYDRYYCTITNLVNPVLELIMFWRFLEYILLHYFLIPIRRGSPERDYL